MRIFPAIDLYEGAAVRLYKGDYDQMTVYSRQPLEVAETFERQGAEAVHLVDLEGARTGGTPNLELVARIARETNLFTEIGGGIRGMETVERYFAAGVDRVILGTAAVTDEAFLKDAVAEHGERVAVGVDIRDGQVAIKGWTRTAGCEFHEFCQRMVDLGVQTLICTDISRDGAMRGTNRALYRDLSRRYGVRIVASGGVSTLEDVEALARMGLYGAIIGKAWYTGAIDLARAIEVAR